METIFSLLKKSHPGVTEEEIVDAVDRAGVIDFAWELRDGLHTVVSPETFQFTPQQKQRMEFAVRILQACHSKPQKQSAIDSTPA